MPVLDLNETNMTATLVTHYVPPPSYFSFFGGNVSLLQNGDIQVNFCAPFGGSIVQELNPQATQAAWQGITPNCRSVPRRSHAQPLPRRAVVSRFDSVVYRRESAYHWQPAKLDWQQ